MNFLHYEFAADADDQIEVVIDRAANVQLLDDSNFRLYSRGAGFRYSGGYATKSPVLFSVPYSGKWHVVIDLGGGPGQVRATARLLEKQAV